jgi:nucleoid-associated protein YgaU
MQVVVRRPSTAAVTSHAGVALVTTGMTSRAGVTSRAGAALVTTGVTVLGLGHLLAGALADLAPAAARSGPAALDAAAGAVAAAAALVLLGWLAVTFVVAVVSEAWLACRPGRARVAGRAGRDRSAAANGRLPLGVPHPVRRLAAAALGVALSAGPVAAHAAVDRPAPPSSVPAATATAARHPEEPPPPGWTPDRPAAGAAAATARAVVVRPGDTLWSLAASRLAPGAQPDDHAVAAAWPRWWHTNRAVIGRDPDLIRPGQVLHPPDDSLEDR